MEFLQVDVFAEAAYRGNPLAVFPEAPDLSRAQMQAIASEMNLSETAFVTAVGGESYDVRIFTPDDEMPFAGHPTLGTCWALLHLGRISGTDLRQTSPGGMTKVSVDGELMWFERSGSAEVDWVDSRSTSHQELARLLGLEEREIGLDAREIGRAGLLRAAYADAGLRCLMVPISDTSALGRCNPDLAGLGRLEADVVYCFTGRGAGRLQARGFASSVGVPEDPATGAAAAALGVYLADRMGEIDFEIDQGIEMGRPSRIRLKAEPGRVRVGGRCVLVLSGRLEHLP